MQAQAQAQQAASGGGEHGAMPVQQPLPADATQPATAQDLAQAGKMVPMVLWAKDQVESWGHMPRVLLPSPPLPLHEALYCNQHAVQHCLASALRKQDSHLHVSLSAHVVQAILQVFLETVLSLFGSLLLLLCVCQPRYDSPRVAFEVPLAQVLLYFTLAS